MLDAAGILGEAGGAGADGRRFPRSAGYSGRSLLPVLRGGRAAAEHRSAAFSEYHRFGIGQHQAGGCYPIRCVRTADWKLAVNLLDGDELYDLHNDPGETVNLIAAAEHAAVRNELHDLLLAHLGETGDLLAGPGWARRPWRGGAAERPFEGYFTTGYRDRWPSGSFFTSGDVAAVEWQLSTAERQEIDTIFAEKGVPTHAETAQITEPFLPAR